MGIASRPVALLGLSAALASTLAPSAGAFAAGIGRGVATGISGTNNLAASAATESPATSSSATIAPPSWDELAESLEELAAGGEVPKPQLTLYRDTNGWCPFCERVWLVLRAKGIAYDEQLVSLQNKPDWYKALVPTTLVPAVLFHGDGASNERRIVWESMDVMRALDEEFPDTPKMMHEDDDHFMDAVKMNDDLSSAGVDFVYGGRNATLTEEEKAERRHNFIAELDRLDETLLGIQAEGGSFRLGREFTAVDALTIPTLERWRYQLPITADIDILENRPGLARWFDAMDSYEPYASRVRGDDYSWTATNSMFLRYFGGGEDKPDVAAAIKRADEAAEQLEGSFVDGMQMDEDGRFAREAVAKLITNHDAVVKDCTNTDPKSQQQIKRATDEGTADLVLRRVASLLVDCAESNTKDIAAQAKAVELCLDLDDEAKDAAALAAKTVASRLCVPRDMSAPAASILRGVLTIVAARLKE